MAVALAEALSGPRLAYSRTHTQAGESGLSVRVRVGAKRFRTKTDDDDDDADYEWSIVEGCCIATAAAGAAFGRSSVRFMVRCVYKHETE